MVLGCHGTTVSYGRLILAVLMKMMSQVVSYEDRLVEVLWTEDDGDCNMFFKARILEDDVRIDGRQVRHFVHLLYDEPQQTEDVYLDELEYRWVEEKPDTKDGSGKKVRSVYLPCASLI
jgi:hypothetical protein